jgi:uncharacterized membrane protein
VLLAIGWRLRERMTGYALILQGGGVGVLYLVIFGAFKLYSLLPPVFAFVLLIARRRALGDPGAPAGRSGARRGRCSGRFPRRRYWSPPARAITSCCSAYYAILNAGIFLIAWFKAWRVLNLLGFVFTAGIGFLWGERSYRPELFASTEPFLILFFVMYVGIAVLFALRQGAEPEGLCRRHPGVRRASGRLRPAGWAPSSHIEYGMAFSGARDGTRLSAAGRGYSTHASRNNSGCSSKAFSRSR